MNRTFDGSRYDLLRSVIPRRVLDDPVAQQRPILHQTKHSNVPPDRCGPAPPIFARFGGKLWIVMNFSAEKSSRKWPCGAFGRTAAVLGTVAALLLAPADPAMARRANPDIWGDLFGVRRPKPRKAAHPV